MLIDFAVSYRTESLAQSLGNREFTMDRPLLISMLAEHIAHTSRSHPIRIAIDGVDGAGKTTLADELVEPIIALGRTVIRSSIDGFHNPRAVRYQLGRESPEGFYHDSFNYSSLTKLLLQPLGPSGSRRFRRATFNYRMDAAVEMETETAEVDEILLFDGIFLLRPELKNYWDITIFLEVPFEVTFSRMAVRDGCSPDIAARENRRYVEGQRLYLESCDPKGTADIVINNSELAEPKIIKWPSGS